MSRALRRVLSGVLLVGSAAFGSCSDGADDSEACVPTRRESLDPAYLVHVLDDADGLDYLSDPPTSGPHQPGPPVTGVVAEALSRPVQVGILERGDVLIQYDPLIDAAARADLEGLANEQVIVAPNPDLPDPIVATAWLFKRTCQRVDASALQTFVDERSGNGPEG